MNIKGIGAALLGKGPGIIEKAGEKPWAPTDVITRAIGFPSPIKPAHAGNKLDITLKI